jgi:hypothetical protein
MGTRSTTLFIETYKDESGKKQKKNKIVVMYRQYDGYPSGHGQELAEFLSKGKMVNGIGVGSNEIVFNGMGCLTAQVVAHFKDGSGGIYLQSNDKDCGEEFRYQVIGDLDTKEITIKVFASCFPTKSKPIFVGTPTEMLYWIGQTENA